MGIRKRACTDTDRTSPERACAVCASPRKGYTNNMPKKATFPPPAPPSCSYFLAVRKPPTKLEQRVCKVPGQKKVGPECTFCLPNRDEVPEEKTRSCVQSSGARSFHGTTREFLH